MQRAKRKIQGKNILIYLNNNFIIDEISLVMSRFNKIFFKSVIVLLTKYG